MPCSACHRIATPDRTQVSALDVAHPNVWDSHRDHAAIGECRQIGSSLLRPFHHLTNPLVLKLRVGLEELLVHLLEVADLIAHHVVVTNDDRVSIGTHLALEVDLFFRKMREHVFVAPRALWLLLAPHTLRVGRTLVGEPREREGA